MLKRIFLFLLTNLAVILVISVLMSIFNVRPYLTEAGIDYRSLLIYAAIIGFTGAIISLFMSKWIAKSAYGIEIIERPANDKQAKLLYTIQRLAQEMRIKMPEVGIYESPEPNAFATGWSKNDSLVAVSTSLLANMSDAELEGVLGHEMSHIGNGDMVTMTLLQGVVNTFVIFFARIAAYAVLQFFRRGSEDDDSSMAGNFIYYLVAMLFELLFGILASIVVMAYSRYREYRADAGSAKYMGKERMIMALRKLQQLYDLPRDDRAPSLAAFKISGKTPIMLLFASHPPIEKRIEVLQRM